MILNYIILYYILLYKTNLDLNLNLNTYIYFWRQMSLSSANIVAELTALMTRRKDKDKDRDRVHGRDDNNNNYAANITPSGFLLDLAHCFWNRVMQIWNLKKSTDNSYLSLSSPESLILPQREKDKDKEKEKERDRSREKENEDGKIFGGERKEEGGNYDDVLAVLVPSRIGMTVKKVEDVWEEDSDKESDSNAANADVIDPQAYRIPCPRSSGGG